MTEWALTTTARPHSTADVAAIVRDAAARRAGLRVVGRGTWLDAGRPVAADAALALDALAGVVEYTPGDFTLTARAGTTLAELARLCAGERQFLALDPFGSDDGTLGATVATASYGPLAHAFGTPRDNVLGVEVVTGAGDVVRAGGRVVKNVAGFDLVRLVTGAWGTLGVVTEVSVRLRAIPEVDATVAVPLPAVGALAPWLERLRGAPLAAWALEMVNGPLAERLGLGRRPLLLARLGGNEAAVAAQRATLGGFGDAAAVDGGAWRALRAEADPGVALVARASARPSRLAALCETLFSPAAAAFGLLAHASADRGVVRFALPGDAGFGLPTFERLDAPPTLIVERMPPGLWPTLGERLVPPRVGDRLSVGVRRAFDPAGVLNPGILR